MNGMNFETTDKNRLLKSDNSLRLCSKLSKIISACFVISGGYAVFHMFIGFKWP